jgi:hypothetical protein
MKSVLQNKILNYEVTPPSGVWEKIADALDESALGQGFSSKLYEAEIIPPVSAWDKIASSLDAEKELTVPAHRRISPLFKYAAAAMLIGFLAWGGIRLLHNGPAKNEIVKSEISQPEKNIAIPQTVPLIETSPQSLVSADNNNSSDEARNDAALEASKKTFAKLDMPVSSRIKKIASGFSFASSLVDENNPGMMSNDEIINCELSSRYITLMTPEGNIVRMSKKLTDMACCVSGEDENKDCKDQMKKWREKIVCSPTCHSAGSFMDILGIVDALQDN